MANRIDRTKLIAEIETAGEEKLARLAAASQKVNESMQAGTAAAHAHDRAQKGVSQSTSNSTKAFSKTAQVSEGLVPIYARLAAQVFAVSAAFQFLKSAGDLSALREGQIAYANATGLAMRTLTKDLIAATGAQINFTDAAQAAAIGTAAGLNPKQLRGLASAAKDVSIVLGRDVTDSFNRLIRGVTKAEPELLDELGIVLRLADATDNYKRSLGIQGELTAFQRSQAVANEVLTQTEQKYSKILAIVDPTANSFNRFGKAFTKVIDDLKVGLNTVLAPLADFFADNIVALGAVLTALAIPVVKSIIPGLNGWADSAKEAAAESKKLAEQADKIAKGQISFAKAFQSNRAIRRERIQIQADAAAEQVRATGLTPRKGSNLELLVGKNAVALEKKQLQSLLREVDSTSKRRNVIFKRMTDTQKSLFKEAITEQIKLNNLMHSTNEARGELMLVRTKGIWASLKASYFSTLAAMKTATAVFAAAVNKILSFVSIIGAITLIGSLAYEAAKYFGIVDDSISETQKRADEFYDKIRSINSELKDIVQVQAALGNTSGLEGAGVIGTAFGNIEPAAISGLVTELQSARDVLSMAGTTIGQNFVDTAFRRDESLGARAKRFVADVIAPLEELTERRSKQDILDDEVRQEAAAASEALERLTDNQKAAVETLINLTNLAGRSNGLGFTKEGKEAIRVLQGMTQGAEITTDALQKAWSTVTRDGQSAAEILRATADNTREFDTIIQRSLNVSDTQRLLTSFTSAISRLEEIELDSAGTELLERQKNERALILQMVDQELALKKALLDIETRTAKANRFSTPFLREQNNLTMQKEQSEQRIADTVRRLAITRAQIKEAEGTSEEELRRNLELEEMSLALEREKLKAIEDQLSASAQLGETLRNSFESNLAGTLAKAIKGESGGVKQAIADLATGVLNSLADTLAKQLTTMVSSSLFGQKTPGQDIKEKMIEAGNIVAEKLRLAILGKKVTGVSSVTNEDGTTSTTETTARVGGLFGLLENLFFKLDSMFGGFLSNLMSIFMSAFGGGGSGGGIGSIIVDGLVSGLTSGLGGAGAGGKSLDKVGKAIPKFAKGGIVTKPTFAHIGEGGMNEAVVPLPDGKSIPIAGNLSGSTNNVAISVNVAADGSSSQTTGQAQGEQAKAIGQVISTAVQEELQRQKRPGGILSPYGAA